MSTSCQPSWIALTALSGVPVFTHLTHLTHLAHSERQDLALRIGRGALVALARLEAASVVHRDLSLHNILVDNESGQLWLVDFDAAVSTVGCSDQSQDIERQIRCTTAAHLLPEPPWTPTSEPVTYNVPPEVFALATRRLYAEVDDAAVVSPSFDLWGLGVAMVHILNCADSTVISRIWSDALATSLTRREEGWDDGLGGRSAIQTRAERFEQWEPRCFNRALHPAGERLSTLLSRLLAARPKERLSAGELLDVVWGDSIDPGALGFIQHMGQPDPNNA